MRLRGRGEGIPLNARNCLGWIQAPPNPPAPQTPPNHLPIRSPASPNSPVLRTPPNYLSWSPVSPNPPMSQTPPNYPICMHHAPKDKGDTGHQRDLARTGRPHGLLLVPNWGAMSPADAHGPWPATTKTKKSPVGRFLLWLLLFARLPLPGFFSGPC
jgi:hypothetical protein